MNFKPVDRLMQANVPVKIEPTEVRIKGKDTRVESTQVCDRIIIITGKWLKIAAVKDEAFVEGEVVPDPELFIAQLKQWEAKPDVFTFTQKITDAQPKFSYNMEWDNFAVIPITTYEDWLRNRIKKDVKENLRRAKREGVVVKIADYDDKFVQGIKDLYDETPIRQGMRFWHWHKPFDVIKQVHGTYLERAEYLGAYLGDELIGFLKMVYVGNIAKTMHVFSKEQHFHKRPANALIAKAVEVCAQKGMSYFIYGESRYPGKKKSSLAEFKKRNGFEEMLYPRYWVSLTGKGRLGIRLGLHHGMQTLIPTPMTELLLKVRSQYYRNLYRPSQSAGK